MLYRKPHELDWSVFNVVIGICKVIKCASCEFYIPKWFYLIQTGQSLEYHYNVKKETLRE